MEVSSKDYLLHEPMKPEDLIGREIIVRWDDDILYEAVVVSYYKKTDEFKLVYRSDDCLEVTKLRNRRWFLAPKRKAERNRPVLEGSIVEFTYPKDGRKYKAMVYDHSDSGARVKVAYIDDYSTDSLKGDGWEYLTTSPCLAQDSRATERDPKPDRKKRARNSQSSGVVKRKNGPAKTSRGPKSPRLS